MDSAPSGAFAWIAQGEGDIPPGAPLREFVHADNLDALADWAARFPGKAAMVLADPPYNARNRKDYHDDDDHDQWLQEIARRVELCKPLLKPDGIWAFHIDDSEQAHLQVLLDRLLGRSRRLNTVVVKMSELAGVKMRYQGKMLPRLKEYVLLYGNGPQARLRPVRRTKEGDSLRSYLRYYGQFLENPEDPVERWKIVPLAQAMADRGLARSASSDAEFRLGHADRMVYRTNNRWFDSLPEAERPGTRLARVRSPWGVEYIWWEGRQLLFLKDHLEEPLGDLWSDISTINVQREGGVALRSGKKPEMLVRRLVELCTDPGDVVVDPWSGSGTTAAVAHKCGRGWLSCERDPGIASRALERLGRVVAGADPTGITEAVGWKGGGGYTTRLPDPERPLARTGGCHDRISPQVPE